MSAPQSTLILLPTEMELRLLYDCADVAALNDGLCETAVCGFGAVASGIATAAILAEIGPKVQRVVLIGIAGSYDLTRFPVGSVISDFSQVACDGVGCGTSDDLQLPSQMGFPMCQIGDRSIFESLPMGAPDSDSVGKTLLTVCRSANDQHDVDRRLDRFPTAVAEDMEGFSVALAAHRMSIPLTIVRGISNQAGDRDKTNWRIRPAMQSAAECLRQLLQSF